MITILRRIKLFFFRSRIELLIIYESNSDTSLDNSFFRLVICIIRESQPHVASECIKNEWENIARKKNCNKIDEIHIERRNSKNSNSHCLKKYLIQPK